MSTPLGTDSKRNGGLLVYYLVLVSLQIFLLVVAVEGVTAHDPGPARAASALGRCTADLLRRFHPLTSCRQEG